MIKKYNIICPRWKEQNYKIILRRDNNNNKGNREEIKSQCQGHTLFKTIYGLK